MQKTGLVMLFAIQCPQEKGIAVQIRSCIAAQTGGSLQHKVQGQMSAE